MPQRLILASTSDIRQQLLTRAGVVFDVVPAQIDEDSIREAMELDGALPRDVVDALAEGKARKIAEKHPGALVIGCDQVLDHHGRILGKPQSRDGAAQQLRALSEDVHRLLSAVVVYDQARPVWRHVGTVCMTMRAISEDYLKGYLDRNWDSVRDSVGAYKLEEEGVRLFSRIEGDHFNVLGLPLLELLSYLTMRGILQK